MTEEQIVALLKQAGPVGGIVGVIVVGLRVAEYVVTRLRKIAADSPKFPAIQPAEELALLRQIKALLEAKANEEKPDA